jgi:hypothetical protein
MTEIDPKTVSLVVGLILTNIGVIAGAYLSLRDKSVKSEVTQEFMKTQIEELRADVKKLGDLWRESKK